MPQGVPLCHQKHHWDCISFRPPTLSEGGEEEVAEEGGEKEGGEEGGKAFSPSLIRAAGGTCCCTTCMGSRARAGTQAELRPRAGLCLRAHSDSRAQSCTFFLALIVHQLLSTRARVSTRQEAERWLKGK